MLSSGVKQSVILFFLAFIYFFLRLNWQETIEFGFDQPRISLAVMEVLEKKDFLNAANYIHPSNASPNTITWGPFLIYFLMPFFLLSRHPVVISQLVAGFNFLGIIFTYLLAKKLFNQKTAIFSAFFLSVFPWSVIFSRMIYNPTPLLTFIPLMIYITVLVVKEKRESLLLILPFIWSMVVQFHILSSCLVLLSFFYLVFHFKKINWKKLFLGILFSLVLWLPLIKYEVANNFRLTQGFLQAPTNLKTNNQKLYENKLTVIEHFFNVLSGKDFKFQLGYAYEDFLKILPSWFFVYQKIFSFVLLLSFVFLFLRLIICKKKNEALIFVWLISLPLFIYLFYLPEIVPRYFLMTLPAEALLMGYFISKILEFISKNKFLTHFLFFLISAFVVFANSFFMVQYYQFILHYTYPEKGWMGWLSRTSDPPFSFCHQALNFSLQEAKKKGFEGIGFSNDPHIKEQFRFNLAQQYIWRYVLKRNFNQAPLLPHYFIILGPPEDNILKSKVKRFGPYSVYQATTS